MTGFPALIASSAVSASSREDTSFFTTSSASPRPSYFAYSARFIDTAPSLNLRQVGPAPIIWTDIPRIIKDRCERRSHDLPLLDRSATPILPVPPQSSVQGRLRLLDKNAAIYRDRRHSLGLRSRPRLGCDVACWPIATVPGIRRMSGVEVPAQPVDATQALNLSAGVSNC